MTNSGFYTKGECILIKNGNLLFREIFNRPHDPHITNAGYFAFNDWKTHADSITSFYVLNNNGEIMLKYDGYITKEKDIPLQSNALPYNT